MMHTPSAGILGRAFRESAAPSDYKSMLRRHEREQRDRLDRKEQAREDDADDDRDLALAAMVSTMEINEYRIELTRYDVATVAALQTNERELLLARGRLNSLLARSYVLPDGRQVWKTQDNSRVFDRNGHELDPSIIDPDDIGDAYPRWEEARETIGAVDDLVRERDQLIDFQEKLDAARERLDAGDITRGEFEAMQDDLATSMPIAVRDQFPESQTPAAARSEDLDIGAGDIPTLTSQKIPGAFAPG